MPEPTINASRSLLYMVILSTRKLDSLICSNCYFTLRNTAESLLLTSETEDFCWQSLPLAELAHSLIHSYLSHDVNLSKS